MKFEPILTEKELLKQVAAVIRGSVTSDDVATMMDMLERQAIFLSKKAADDRWKDRPLTKCRSHIYWEVLAKELGDFAKKIKRLKSGRQNQKL